MIKRAEKKFSIPQAKRELKARYIPVLLSLLLLGFLVFLLHGFTFSESFRSAIQVPFGYTGEDVMEISEIGKLFLAILMIADWVVIWMAAESVIDKVITGKLDEVFSMKSLEQRIKKLKGHTIVCGGGRLGLEVARRLSEAKLPYILVDRDKGVVMELKEKGFLVLEGDATKEGVLETAGINSAKNIVCAFGEDTDNVFLVLTAKELNPNLKIITRANHEEVVSKLRQAGANEIILPAVIGGDLMFEHINPKRDKK